jgi:hypothetical protein
MSNWLEPAWARAAMAIGRPATETAGADAEDAAAVAVWAVAAFGARMPKVGKLAAAAFTVLAAACAPGEALPDAVVSACAVVRLAAGAAAASLGGPAGAVDCWDAAALDASALAERSVAEAGFPAAASAVGALPSV